MLTVLGTEALCFKMPFLGCTLKICGIFVKLLLPIAGVIKYFAEGYEWDRFVSSSNFVSLEYTGVDEINEGIRSLDSGVECLRSILPRRFFQQHVYQKHAFCYKYSFYRKKFLLERAWTTRYSSCSRAQLTAPNTGSLF